MRENRSQPHPTSRGSRSDLRRAGGVRGHRLSADFRLEFIGETNRVHLPRMPDSLESVDVRRDDAMVLLRLPCEGESANAEKPRSPRPSEADAGAGISGQFFGDLGSSRLRADDDRASREHDRDRPGPDAREGGLQSYRLPANRGCEREGIREPDKARCESSAAAEGVPVNVLGDSSAGPPPRSAIEGSDDGLIACHVRSQVLLGDRGRDYCQESIGALGARLLLARLSPGYSSGGAPCCPPKGART